MHLPRIHVRLNDRERTLGLIVLLSLFLGFNYLFLLPRIERWRALSVQLGEASRRLATLEDGIARQPDWPARIRELEPFIARGLGAAIDSETKLQDLATRLTSRHGITVDRLGRVVTEESAGFRALRLDLNFKQAQTSALIEFLHELYNQPGLLEVRSMTISAARLNPRDPRVEGDLTFASMLPRRERLQQLVARVPGLAPMVPRELGGTAPTPLAEGGGPAGPEPEEPAPAADETEIAEELATLGMPDVASPPSSLTPPEPTEWSEPAPDTAAPDTAAIAGSGDAEGETAPAPAAPAPVADEAAPAAEERAAAPDESPLTVPESTPSAPAPGSPPPPAASANP